MERPSGERHRCAVGSATDNPCPRAATEYVNRDDRPDWCWPHLFLTKIREAAEDTSMLLGELEAELERWILSQQADQ